MWSRPTNGYAVCPTTHRSRALISALFVDWSMVERAIQWLCSMPGHRPSLSCIVILFVNRSVVWSRPTNGYAVCPTIHRSRALISALFVDWSVVERDNQWLCSMSDDSSISCIVILFVDRSVVWRRTSNGYDVCHTSKRSRALISALFVDWSVVEQAIQWLCSMPDNPPISCTDKMVWNRPSNGYAVCPTTHRFHALIKWCGTGHPMAMLYTRPPTVLVH